MKYSIVIPTYNNIEYLKLLIKSIIENSIFKHEIIVHVNDGSDGTLHFIKKKKIKYTYSKNNIGLCRSVNLSSQLVTTNYILYAHDDMYFCKNWDYFLDLELKKYKNNLFYISGTNVSSKNGLIDFNCGSNPKNFDSKKFNNFCKYNKSNDLQGSHWAPHIIHISLWKKISGFSEEFSPGDGSDPDLCMKLWNQKVRVFKSISLFKVYHFGSKTVRNGKIKKNNGTKIFLLKWGFNPRFFRKFYLRGDGNIKYTAKLSEPVKNFTFLFYFCVNKIKFFYYKFISNDK